jgi:two-component system, NtrC family, sensor kinase
MRWGGRTRVHATSAARSSSGPFSRRLARSFAMVAIVATAACILLLLFLVRVANSVHQMQRDEVSIRTALRVAMAVREQYIHAAHTLIIGDASHLDHYAEWVLEVQDGARGLRARIPEHERWRIDRIEQISRDVDALFRTEGLPATLAHDKPRMLTVHAVLEEKISIASADADWLTQVAEGRMSGEHVSTTRTTYAGVLVAGLGIVLLAGLSILSTRKLRAAVLRPLRSLVEAATRIGAGDLSARVGESSDGELGLVGRAFDQMAEQLSEHQRRLITVERMAAIGQLAAGVAHEINNPIGVIRGYLRTMIPEAERDELRRELRILDEEAAACQRIADDLVAYARAPEISRTDVDIGELLSETAERFQASGESLKSPIRVEAEGARLSVDPVRLRQVVQNLLKNAIQAGPKGSPVEVYGHARTSGYFIRVLDRGVGVPSEMLTRIFEPFQSGRINGTGLGLAVCAGILRAHGGHISARARDGGGSEFVVELPHSGREASALHA